MSAKISQEDLESKKLIVRKTIVLNREIKEVWGIIIGENDASELLADDVLFNLSFTESNEWNKITYLLLKRIEALEAQILALKEK